LLAKANKSSSVDTISLIHARQAVSRPRKHRSTSGVLKNAIDYVYAEWNNKAMGVVSYGASGGTRAAEHLRLIAGELQMADVRTNVALSLFTDFKDSTDLAPGAHQTQARDHA
jgi:NAD(P)H-dependent FMN reductase